MSLYNTFRESGLSVCGTVIAIMASAVLLPLALLTVKFSSKECDVFTSFDADEWNAQHSEEDKKV